MRTAVILPTWSRVEQATMCTRRLLGTSAADVVIVTEDDLTGFGDLLDNARVKFKAVHPRMTAVQKWNYGLECEPNYEAYVLGADDLWAHDDWHDEALKVQQGAEVGFIGINDGSTDGSILSAHYLMTREFIVKHHGGVLAVPHYRSWGLDEEATIRAKRADQFAYAQHSVLEHRHWLWNMTAIDQTYAIARHAHNYDISTLKYRRSMGWPDDFPAVIS